MAPEPASCAGWRARLLPAACCSSFTPAAAALRLRLAGALAPAADATDSAGAALLRALGAAPAAAAPAALLALGAREGSGLTRARAAAGR
jgi:hypothetical protein